MIVLNTGTPRGCYLLLMLYSSFTCMKLTNVIKTGSKIIGRELLFLKIAYKCRTMKRSCAILADHFPCDLFKFLPSQRRLINFETTKRFTTSFYSSAVNIVFYIG